MDEKEHQVPIIPLDNVLNSKGTLTLSDGRRRDTDLPDAPRRSMNIELKNKEYVPVTRSNSTGDRSEVKRLLKLENLLIQIQKDLSLLKFGHVDDEIIPNKTIQEKLYEESYRTPRSKLISRMDAIVNNTQLLLQHYSTFNALMVEVKCLRKELEAQNEIILDELEYIRNKIDYLCEEVDMGNADTDNLNKSKDEKTKEKLSVH